MTALKATKNTPQHSHNCIISLAHPNPGNSRRKPAVSVPCVDKGRRNNGGGVLAVSAV